MVFLKRTLPCAINSINVNLENPSEIISAGVEYSKDLIAARDYLLLTPTPTSLKFYHNQNKYTPPGMTIYHGTYLDLLNPPPY